MKRIALGFLDGAGLLAAPVTVAPAAHACTPYGNQAAGFGGSYRTCYPDGSAYVCDNGWTPFGTVVNCFHAPVGHPRNP